MQEIFSKYEQTCYKTIGSNLKFYRIRAKITQEILSDKINCSREFINRVENNKEHIGLQKLIKVSFILKIPLEKFFVTSDK